MDNYLTHPQLVKDVHIFLLSMVELIRRYEQAVEEECSKSTIECRLNLSCLLCEPIGCEVKFRDLPIEHSYTYEEYPSLISEQQPGIPRHNARCMYRGCPWITILGMTCDQYSQKNNIEAIYLTGDTVLIGNRINQLKEWIEIYKTL